jgi:hypothetical protein
MPHRYLFASVLLMPLFTTHAHAQTRQWRQTAALPSGTPLQLHLRDNPFPVTCDLVWIDLNAIACETYDFNGTPHRTIYPATSVAAIKRRHPRPLPGYQSDDTHDRALLIAMGVGALIGGVGGSQNSVGGGFAFAGIGALVGAAFVGAVTQQIP